MNKPLVCFLSFNRAGAAASNLISLLKTEDDFDLCIIDNGSTDGIWEFIENIKDHRIKFKHRFDNNYGVVYAINYAQSKLEKNQPFIHIENDVLINDSHWIKKFEETLNTFPELGLIGVVSKGHFQSSLKMLYPQFRNGVPCYFANIIIGCCNYVIPEVLDIVGYRNEECCGADKEFASRINMCTPYKTGYTGLFNIDFRTQISCDQCPMASHCKFERNVPCECCRVYYPKLYTHKSFSSIAYKKTVDYLHKLKLGQCDCYSASIHDPESLKNHNYNYKSAQENFDFFSNYSSN